jgi:hypothetical protein
MSNLNGMKLSILAPASLALAAITSGFPQISYAANAGTCVTTQPSGEILGKPFPASEHWYGSEALAVMLPPEGIWRGMGPAYHYRNKLFWWSSGFEPGRESQLKVTGRRLDADAPPANITSASGAYSPSLGGWAMLVAAEFPGPGCWEIAARYLGQDLKFVVEVVATK